MLKWTYHAITPQPAKMLGYWTAEHADYDLCIYYYGFSNYGGVVYDMDKRVAAVAPDHTGFEACKAGIIAEFIKLLSAKIEGLQTALDSLSPHL
jgi:hypothetical protein